MSVAELQLKGDALASDHCLAVEVIDLVHRYSGLEVISSTSLNVREGEFVSIVGPSGCGKTTLLNIVAGLTPAPAYREGHALARLGRPERI
jgi:ABC-type nitrate/sulfonate/bicarbonate transport system ATPase subunit